MRIGICQTQMHDTIEDNLKNVLRCAEECSENDVDLAIFPECGLTGFHRHLPQQLNKALLNDSLEILSDFAAKKKISILIGTPNIVSDEGILNSAFLFNPQKEKNEHTSKVNLTEAEKRFFTKAETRGTLKTENLNIGVVFCIEMNYKAELIRDFQDANLDLIAWISYIKWNDESIPENRINFQISEEIPSELGVPIVNVNWANAVNDKTLTGLGGSRFIEGGNVVFKLDEDKEVIKYLDIDLKR